MSARELLLKVMAPNHTLDEANSLLISRAVDDILAIHAHELAEKIRAYGLTPTGDTDYDAGRDAGRESSADLIDPEVA